MKAYIENIIKTGLANDLTLDQIKANPEAAAKAYLQSQLKAINASGKQIQKQFQNA